MATEAPLTYGQLSTWRSIVTFAEDRLMEVNVPATWDLRGLSAESVHAAMARLTERHESLRTTYHEVDGRPVQRIHDDLPPRIEHIERETYDLEDRTRVTNELYQVPFPVTGDPGWRARLVSVAGQPQFLALSLSHMVVDLWAIRELEAQFHAIAADPTAYPEPGPAPRKLAELQHGDPWQARRQRAETYWRKILANGPLRNLPAPPPNRTSERRIQATLRSHKLAMLVSAAAAAHGVSQQSVVMAATAVALGQITSHPRVMLSLMSANRFDPQWRSLISTQNQLVPLICDLDPGQDLARYLKRAHFNAMLAYRNGSYDVDRAAELAEQVLTPDGDRFDHDCWFNYVAEEPVQPFDPAWNDAPAELSWTPPMRHAGHPFSARVHSDGAQWIDITFRVDPDLIPAEALVRALRTTARCVLQFATEPETPLGAVVEADGPALPPAIFPPDVPEPAEPAR